MTIYQSEKDMLINRMQSILSDATKGEDDAGQNWFTLNNRTFIGDVSNRVSSDVEIAQLVNAINALNGHPELINNDPNEETQASEPSRVLYLVNAFAYGEDDFILDVQETRDADEVAIEWVESTFGGRASATKIERCQI